MHRTCFGESIVDPALLCWAGLNRTLNAEWRVRALSLALLAICPSLQHRTLLDFLLQGLWKDGPLGPPGASQLDSSSLHWCLGLLSHRCRTLHSLSWTAWAAPQPIPPTCPGPSGRQLNPVLYQLFQAGECALCPSVQMVDSIDLSINSGLPPPVPVLVLLIAMPWFPAVPAVFSPHLCALTSCLLPEQQYRVVPIAQHRPGSFPSKAACFSLHACAQGRSSYLICVHCPCVPISQGFCLTSPTLCPLSFLVLSSPCLIGQPLSRCFCPI